MIFIDMVSPIFYNIESEAVISDRINYKYERDSRRQWTPIQTMTPTDVII